MDPTVALYDLLDIASDGDESDIDAIQDRALALIEWHQKGGALPDIKTALDKMVLTLSRIARSRLRT